MKKIIERISVLIFAMILGSTGIGMSVKAEKLRTEELGTFYTFEYTGGTQEFEVPASGLYSLECWGAKGSDHYEVGGGAGGYIYTQINLKKGDILYVLTGGAASGLSGGYNGGGAGGDWGSTRVNASAGGGGTDIRTVAGDYNSRIVSAGGGAGGYGRQQGSDSVFYGGESAVAGGSASGRLFQGSNAVESQGGGGGGWYGGASNGGGANGYTPNGVQIVRDGRNATLTVVAGSCITKAGSQAMPVYSKTTGSSYDSITQTTYSTMTGNRGNGFAIITYLKPSIIELRDTTTIDSKAAIFSTSVSEVSEYSWYYFENDTNSEYYNDWRKIGSIASSETNILSAEKNGKKFSMKMQYSEAYRETMAELTLENTNRAADDGLKIKCVAKGKEEIESECTLKVLKNGYQEIVASYFKTLAAGTTINIDSVLVALLYESGSPTFASGWSNLYFVSADENGSEVESKVAYVELGDNTYRVRLKDENPEPILDDQGKPILDAGGNPTYNDCTRETSFQSKGIDDKYPQFGSIFLSEYELMNEDAEVKAIDITVTLNATDNFSQEKNLMYAFKPKDVTVQDADYTAAKEYKIAVSQNTVYTAYVKDQAGNVTTQEVNIIVADTEDPVITSKAMIFKEEDGWVTKNILEVKATDNYKPEQLQYRFTPPAGIKAKAAEENPFGIWSSLNSIVISENGIYTIEVKDFVGNITTTTIDVKNVDATAPKITNVEIKTV